VPPMTGDYDKYFMEGVANHKLPILEPVLPPEQWQYIYRWGVSRHHASGGVPNVKYQEAGSLPIVPGEHMLTPRWLQPYDKFVNQALLNKTQREGVKYVEEYVGDPNEAKTV